MFRHDPDSPGYLKVTDERGASLLRKTVERIDEHESIHARIFERFVNGLKNEFTSEKDNCDSGIACALAVIDIADQAERWQKNEEARLNREQTDWNEVLDISRFEDVESYIEDYLHGGE